MLPFPQTWIFFREWVRFASFSRASFTCVIRFSLMHDCLFINGSYFDSGLNLHSSTLMWNNSTSRFRSEYFSSASCLWEFQKYNPLLKPSQNACENTNLPLLSFSSSIFNNSISSRLWPHFLRGSCWLLWDLISGIIFKHRFFQKFTSQL